MTLLILITLLWAASFSLIGVYLAGQVDGYIVVFIRMILALITVLPLFRWRHLSPKSGQLPQLTKLAVIGAIQIGAMYLFLYHAFLYLSVAEVLLFTIFTPLYITLIDELILNRKHLPLLWWIAAAVSVCGAAIIRYQPLSDDFITGFFLIQAANACFALGQVAYKRLPTGKTLAQSQQFAAFFFGASVIAGLGVLLFAEDVSSSSELKVRDEAGNVTTLSPHNFDLIPAGASEDMAWSYYSEKDGKRINVDMLKALRVLEQISGEKLVYTEE